MKKKIRIIICIVLMLYFGMENQVYAEEERKFSGTREIVCVISKSDISNFIAGGRTTLEMLLVQKKEEWYNIYSESQGMDLELYLEFSFDSYEDYESKVKKLIGYMPITTYGEAEYMENFASIELFHFLEIGLQEIDALEEIEFQQLLNVKNDKMDLNGKVYEGTEILNTSGHSQFKFQSISMITVWAENSYIREIQLDFSQESKRALESLKERCEKVDGEIENGNLESCKVTFSASSEEELIKNTMLILGVPVNITHEKSIYSEEYVWLTTQETVDIQKILDKDGEFYYMFEAPDSWAELTEVKKEVSKSGQQQGDESNAEKTQVSENCISYNGTKGIITYCYKAPLAYDRIMICTDISNEFHKIKRTVTFMMNRNIADSLYETTKKQFQEKLRPGDVLKIYDEDEYRCYEWSYSSWFTGDIARFTNRVFEVTGSNLKVIRNPFPFVKSKIEDNASLQNSNMKSDSNIIYIEYILPDNARVSDKVESGKCISVNTFSEYSINTEFVCFFYKKFIVYIGTLGVFILGIAQIVHSLKRKHLKKREGKKVKNTVKLKQKFCPQCGQGRRGNTAFCPWCGYKYKD